MLNTDVEGIFQELSPLYYNKKSNRDNVVTSVPIFFPLKFILLQVSIFNLFHFQISKFPFSNYYIKSSNYVCEYKTVEIYIYNPQFF